MRKLVYWLVAAILLLVVAAAAFRIQPTVYLMPTPAVLSAGTLNPFALNPNQEKSNRLRILYATNRAPADHDSDQPYSTSPGNALRMGVVDMRIGDDETAWEKILRLSTSSDDAKRPPLRLEQLRELAQYPLNDRSASLPGTRALVDAVNEALDRSLDKDITIYVHGANTGIYRACAQAAQYQHFTGRNSVVLAYLWPSAENLLRYGKDTRHALESAPALALLLELLARYTAARSINILAYSAGAQVLSPALDILGRSTEDKDRQSLRIGTAYFAAADIAVDSFVSHLANYIDIPRNTTAAVNQRDSVLALAAWRGKISRVGSPQRDDVSRAQHAWIRAESASLRLSIIGVSPGTVSGMSARSHDFWYTHPWVSSDVLVQFLLRKDPRERGLVESVRGDDLRYWTFPPDYPERIVKIINKATARN